MGSFRGKFVVQQHSKANQPTHWDLMLEKPDTLQTWRLNKQPQKDEYAALATKIVDHDKRFLNYEGPVNTGIGSVHILDKGTFEMIEESQERILLRFRGSILNGIFVFTHSERDLWAFSIFNIQ